MNLILASAVFAAISTATMAQTFQNSLITTGRITGPTFSGQIVEGQGIHCAPGGCIDSGPFCDTAAISGQCAFPPGTLLATACAGTPGCVAVTCNAETEECYARSVADVTPMAGFNSVIFGGSNDGSTFSDSRLKTSVERIGTTAHSLPLYRFSYIDSEGQYEGVMAQDVLDVIPEAVTVAENGYYFVDYNMLGIIMRRID